MTSDPIGLGGGLNTYGYVSANPINVYDLNGLLGVQDGLIDGVFEFATQLAENDGNLTCIDFRAVAIAGVSGTFSLNYLARLKRIQRLAGLLKNKFSKVSNKTVGRHMNPDELAKMRKIGKVQEGGGGQTRVADPSDPNTFRNPPKGDVFVEFDVPANRVLPHSKGTGRIPGPNSPDARVPGRNPADFEMPSATNIKVP